MGVGSYKMLGSGRKEGNYETMLNILQYKEKRLKVGVQAKRSGSRECKALEVGDLDSLSPCHTFCEPSYITDQIFSFVILELF